MIFSTILLLFHMSNANSSLTVMTFNMYHFGAHVSDFLASNYLLSSTYAYGRIYQVNDGLRKIADQISFINPDIVALQVRYSHFWTISGRTRRILSNELRLYRRPEKDLEALCSLLGEDWSGALNTRGETDSRGVITRHKVSLRILLARTLLENCEQNMEKISKIGSIRHFSK